MDIEAHEQINNFMPEVQEEVDMGEEEPPLPDVTSLVQVSSSSSEDTTSLMSSGNAAVTSGSA
jgi:hypothetical protein